MLLRKNHLSPSTLLIFFFLLSSFLFLQSCSNSESDVKKKARDKVEQSVGTSSEFAPANANVFNAGAPVFHYICPSGHDEGSNELGGVCSQCGLEFTHNQAFHDQQAQVSGATNISGVYHYSCPNGHDHGSDAMGGTCPECGAEFTHNQAYHDQQAQPQINTEMVANTNPTGIYHYTCPNGHDQGSDTMGGTCSECGAEFVHNQAFHDQQANPESMIDFQPQVTPPTVPAGNNSGVFHYTCPNGHDGGSNSMGGTCVVCGSALVHNQAYHDQGF